MIAGESKRMVAFRCANCGTVNKSINNIFAIPGDKKVLKCSCGNKLEIVTTQDKKLRFSLLCRFCGNTHQFNISPSTIFNCERLILPCDVTGFDILFIGTPGKVYQAIEKAEEYLDEWAAAGDEQDYSDDDLPENGDELLSSMVISTLRELAMTHKIFCNCKKGEGSFVVERFSDNIVIRCKKCGCEKRIETHEGSLDAYNVVECTELHLEKR